MSNSLIKNIKAYPVLHRKFMDYIAGVEPMPEGFNAKKLFRDYVKVRFKNPGRRISMSEYMIFALYNCTHEQQQEYLTDVEATLLMRPYNSDSEPFLKDKVCFLQNFGRFVHRDWLYLPDATEAEFRDFAKKHPVMALKPPSQAGVLVLCVWISLRWLM